MTLGSHTGPVQLAVRAAIAATLSLAIAQYFGLQYPIYAFIAAVIVTDLTPALSRQLGLRRIVATLVGALIGATLSLLLPASVWSIGLGVLVAMLACHFFRAQESAKIAGYVCGIIVFDHGAEPWSYALLRLIETLLGVSVAWLISYAPKLLRDDGAGAKQD